MIDPLSILLHHTTEALDISSIDPILTGRTKRNRYLALITHDIFRIFNNTSRLPLTTILQHHNIPNNLTKWVDSFTSERTLSFGFNNRLENLKHFFSGLSRDSPISPVLLLIYTQAMLNTLPQTDATDVFYMYYDAMLQVSKSQKSTIRFLTE